MGKAANVMQGFALNQAIKYLEKNPEKNMVKVLDMVDAACPEGWYEPHRKAVRNSFESKDNWYQLILKIRNFTSKRKTKRIKIGNEVFGQKNKRRLVSRNFGIALLGK